jgi:hypothetical protein
MGRLWPAVGPFASIKSSYYHPANVHFLTDTAARLHLLTVLSVFDSSLDPPTWLAGVGHFEGFGWRVLGPQEVAVVGGSVGGSPTGQGGTF